MSLHIQDAGLVAACQNLALDDYAYSWKCQGVELL